MAERARSAGAQFLLAINPTLYSSDYDHPTPDIVYAGDLGNRLYPGQAEVTRRVRPALAEAARELQVRGVDAIDLSGLFRDKTVDVFVEPSHLNATGHDMLAAAIAREMLRSAGP